MSASPIVEFELSGASEEDWHLIRERVREMQPTFRDETHFALLSALPSADLLILLQAGLSPGCSIKLLGRRTVVHDDPSFDPRRP